ncbi:MAG: hypothetical protein AAFN74_12565 [Myxococcota bacterium]
MVIQGMRKKRAFVGTIVLMSAAVLASAGCSEESQGSCLRSVVTSDQSCTVAADCAAAGLDLTCINGTCRLACRVDSECDPTLNADPACEAESSTVTVAICQAGVCEPGCTSNASCEDGEVCFEGRCALYAEGFEPLGNAVGVDLGVLGFNDLPVELNNTRTEVLFQGIEDCIPAVDRNCSGPAGQGRYFAILETAPTPPKGTPVTGATCRACACCLECLANPPPVPANLNNCPSTPDIPTPLMCPVSHPNCNGVCSACDQCDPANRPTVASNPFLVSCEKTAANRRCALCDACDNFLSTCQAQSCPICATEPTSQACRNCVDTNCLGDPRCVDCLTCADAQNCARSDPGSAECNRLNDACDAQGAAGCFDVPIDYLRAGLTDLEQALVSPAIDLSSATTGDVVMQFDYVSFDVGVSYFRGEQGVLPSLWQQVPQNVRVQFCSGNCTSESSWVDATQVNGVPGLFPADAQRNNGRLLGDQTLIDWRTSRLRLSVPSVLRTAQFRYRLLPSLADGARVGVDNILIRRVP